MPGARRDMRVGNVGALACSALAAVFASSRCGVGTLRHAARPVGRSSIAAALQIAACTGPGSEAICNRGGGRGAQLWRGRSARYR